MAAEPLTGASRRELCYAARDAFHACLERSGEDATQCVKEKADYDERCLRSWRRYFDDKRKSEQRKRLYQAEAAKRQQS